MPRDWLTYSEQMTLRAQRKYGLNATARPVAAAPASPPPAPDPIAAARAAGAEDAKRNSLAMLAVCDGFGRPDLAPIVIGRGLSVAEARQAIIARIWDESFERAAAAGDAERAH